MYVNTLLLDILLDRGKHPCYRACQFFYSIKKWHLVKATKNPAAFNALTELYANK